MSGSDLYKGRADLASKTVYVCECGATVGCHPGTSRPLGRPAGPMTRRVRISAHETFDPIWRDLKLFSRTQAYKILARALGIAHRDCHIGAMDAQMAGRAREIASQIRELFS